MSARRPLWIPLALLAACSDSQGVADATSDARDGAAALDAPMDDVRTDDARTDDVVALDASLDASSDASLDARADTTPDAGASTPYVYVGLGNGDIALFAMDPASAALTPRGRFPAGNYPSFIVADGAAHHLYAVNEPGNAVAAFAIDPRTGALTLLNRVSVDNGPAFVGLDRTGAHVFVANYNGGSVAVFPVRADGSLGAATDRETPGTNPHSMYADPSNRVVYVPCLGSDLVAQFRYDPTMGVLTPAASVSTAPGAGPRHLALTPDGRFAYVMNERNSTVTLYAVDAAAGTLAPRQTLSTLPPGAPSAGNTGADVHVAPSGRFLYGSNRGHNSIVAFAIDATTGMLTLVGHQPTMGNTPRNFGLDPTGTFLFVANQGSNNVVTFHIDPSAGTLSHLATTATAAAPYWVGVVPVR